MTSFAISNIFTSDLSRGNQDQFSFIKLNLIKNVRQKDKVADQE